MNPARLVPVLAFLSLAPVLCWGQNATPAPSPGPAAQAVKGPAASNDPIARIRAEGLERSQVMNTLSYLTDIVGPRLTGSPGLRRASEWSRDQLTHWGLVKAQLEPWGPFGRGWTLRRFSAQVVAPQSIPLIGFPKAWSPTLGAKPLEADVVHVDITKSEDFEKFRGKLKGKIVLDGPLREIKVRFESPAVRHTDASLLTLANSDGSSATTRVSSTVPNPLATPEQRAALALLPRRYQFFSEEGVAVIVQPSRIGEAGTLFTAAATVYPPRGPEGAKKNADQPTSPDAKAKTPAPIRSVSPWKTDAPPIVPQVNLAAEHYNRLVRMLQQGEKLRMAVELQAEYHTKNLMEANVVAEIPGSDLAGEVVMLGAHLDSWQSGTGATDNAAGSAVVMEAVRILKALDLKPRRTIRIALWTGEEQGLLGSKAYVAQHFGIAKSTTAAAASPGTEPPTFTPPPPGTTPDVEKKPAHEHLSVYFNLDNGGGKIRGVYLQRNEAVAPLFRQWLKPFKDLGAETLSLRSTGGTDHLSFDNVGLPGFQFIQDDIEYTTRTHHSNMDVYDRVIPEDLKQASVIMATFVYQAAMRDEKIPRKPIATPAPVAAATPVSGTTQ